MFTNMHQLVGKVETTVSKPEVWAFRLQGGICLHTLTSSFGIITVYKQCINDRMNDVSFLGNQAFAINLSLSLSNMN